MTFNPTAANKERMDAWLASLAEATDQAALSEELTRYLATLAKFWQYSAHNVMLIALQMPTATRVAGRKKWEALGRRVKKDEWKHSIQILCPHFAKDGDTGEQVLQYFSTGYVYDVSQTEGEPLPELAWQATDGERFVALRDRLVDLARARGLTVVFHELRPGLLGFSTGVGAIVIKEGEPAGNQCQTILHELCHEWCHGRPERERFTRQQLECQAEAIAYVCCSALGIPAPNAPQYLALYGVTGEVIAANLEAIRAGAATVLGRLEGRVGVDTGMTAA